MSGAAHAETNRVVLHGRLAELFGGPFDLGVTSPADAVRVLCMFKQGFRQALNEGAYQVFYGKPERGVDLGLDQLTIGLGHGNEVHFVPVAAGSGGRAGGIGKVILGVAIIATAFLLPGSFPIVLGAGIEISAGSVAMFGVSMVLNGISTIFAPQPQGPQRQKPRESFLMSGAVNSIGQGQPVPLAYGLIRANTHVISLTYTVADIPLDYKGSDNPSSSEGGGGWTHGEPRSGRTKTGSTDTVQGDPVPGEEYSGTYYDPNANTTG